MTHLLLVVDICTKYENGPSSGRKVTVRTKFCCPFLAKTWADGLEDMGQGHIMTHSLSGEYTNYGKDPSSGTKLGADTI